jgi:nicotinamidase-related amidase
MTNRTALIAVNTQKDYLPKGALGFPGTDRIIAPLVEYATVAADLVIVSRELHPPDHRSFVGFGGHLPPHCIKGTSGAKVIPDLATVIAQKDSYVISSGIDRDQGGFSAFEGGTLRPLESLEDILAREKITHVAVGGYWLEYAVSNTAFDANALGYNTAVELTASCALEKHEKPCQTIERFERAGIKYV